MIRKSGLPVFRKIMLQLEIQTLIRFNLIGSESGSGNEVTVRGPHAEALASNKRYFAVIKPLLRSRLAESSKSNAVPADKTGRRSIWLCFRQAIRPGELRCRDRKVWRAMFRAPNEAPRRT